MVEDDRWLAPSTGQRRVDGLFDVIHVLKPTCGLVRGGLGVTMSLLSMDVLFRLGVQQNSTRRRTKQKKGYHTRPPIRVLLKNNYFTYRWHWW
jgi:hypothetical protein